MNVKILILQCMALLQSVIAYCPSSEVISVDDAGGRIESPGYPYTYPDNQNCKWILKAPEHYKVVLTFNLPFETELSYDRVQIYNGENVNGVQLGNFSGSLLPPTVYSKGTAMTVTFSSDRGEARKGFSATYMIREKLEFITKPSDVEIAGSSGQSLVMTCRVNGSLTPQINWTHDGVQLVTGGRFTIQPEGDLEIIDVQYSDRGTYTCLAWDGADVIKTVATVTVRNRTVIERNYPSSSVHNFAADGRPVHINCTLSEYDKMLNVSVEWKRKDERINVSSDSRITIINNKQGHRIISSQLTIVNVTIEDTGPYYCVARTRMDEDSDYVLLNVISKPNPPRVTKVKCYAKEAEVSWQSTPGSPASNFIVQYRTSFAPDVWETAADNISTIPTSEQGYIVRVPLSLQNNFTFRMLARNEAGFSDPSQPFPLTCTTGEGVPKKHPDDVTAQRRDPAYLVVSWTPLSLNEHQGSQLYYEVWWKPNNPDATWLSVKLIDWTEGELVIGVERTPQEYVVFVLAGNIKGVAVQPVQKVYAYAGAPRTLSRSDYNLEMTGARLNGSRV